MTRTERTVTVKYTEILAARLVAGMLTVAVVVLTAIILWR